jgi:DNA-binding transcriptional MerR regulator
MRPEPIEDGVPDGTERDPGADPVFSIGAMVRMLDVDAATLRAWEGRYGVVVPARTKGGQRLYSRNDLDNLRFVGRAMDQGSGPGDAHRLLDEELRSPERTRATDPAPSAAAVLLVERDRYAAELARHLLRTEGYDVQVAFEPKVAKDLCARLRPVLTIVDLMVAGGGFELCAWLSEHGDAPVLAVCALDLADAALERGASAFLAKPIDLSCLVSTVHDLLGDRDGARARSPRSA